MGSAPKLEIPLKVEKSWQSMLDILARVCHIPAALIMKIEPETIEVFAKSSNEDNPYKVGASEELHGELYCEHVLKHDAELLIPNALKDEDWKDNPDIALSMIAYCGLPIHWPDGSHFGTICILDRKENRFSVTYRELLASFRDAVENSLELIEAIHLKDSILSIAAHDLRTPLSQIETLVGMMLEEEKKLETVMDVEIPKLIHGSVASMRDLMEQLLKAQEVESLKGQARLETFDLSRILAECFSEMDRVLKGKKQTLNRNWPDKLKVCGSRVYLKDAIVNLLSNASKYSPEGSEISVSVRCDDRGNVAIHILDQGPGFTEEDHDRIFGKFQKLSARPTGGESSCGLGLYIVSCIANFHGGRVSARRSSDTGAELIFSWPGLQSS